MSFGAALNALANPAPPVGKPPTVAAIPPPPNPNAAPPAYDIAHDPGWKGMVDPHDHALRNFLNGISPEERELLRAWKFGAQAPAAPIPPAAPAVVAPPAPGF